MRKNNPGILQDSQLLWNYLVLSEPVEKSDGIIIFCSNDLRVAEFAASLFHKGYASWICPSGGIGRLTYNLFSKPEAMAFTDVLVKNGVPENIIYPEIRATNSAENTFFTRDLINKENLPHSRLIVLQKPYMERRTLATLTRYWPDQRYIVSSPPTTFEDYPFPGFTQTDLIHVLVGEVQRMILYSERGWHSAQTIPDDVYSAFIRLIEAGYTGQLANPSALPSIPS